MRRSVMSLWCYLLFFWSNFHAEFSYSSLLEHSCVYDQMSALLQVKYEQSCSYGYDTLKSWKPNTDCCSWTGVTCDGLTGYVIGLDLSSSELCGSIHSTSRLFHLRHLQSLTLFNNSFNGSIPYGFDQLSRLTNLDLSNNHFVNQIPLEISRLTNLVSLDLSLNIGLKLENPNLRTLIQNLSNLIELRLDWVNMSNHDNNDWYQSLSLMLPKLQQLSLSNCSLSGPMDSSLSNLHFLSELNLNFNNLSSMLFQDLMGKLPPLRVLGLSSTELYGEFPNNFFTLQAGIQHLDLSFNYLLSGYIPEIPYVNSLRSLDLTSTKLCRKLPNSIENLKLLEASYFYNCSLSGSIPSILPSFANLANLHILDLSHNSLTGQIPSLFKDQFSNLRRLMLRNNFLQGPIPSSLANLTNLHLLDLSYNNLTGQIHSFFNDGFSNLRYVTFRSNLLNGPVPSSLLSIPSLWYVDLMQNQFNDILDDFSTCNGTNLEVLDLSYNKLRGVIPNCFGHLIGHLRLLNLEGNSLSGPIPDTYTTKGCKLQMFKLNRNRLYGKLPISLANCMDLEELDLGNNQLSGTFPFWLQTLPQLSVLVLRSNKFYGPIQQKSKVDVSPFPMLHVFDISLNNFIGKLPLEYICQWKSMLATGAPQQAHYLSLQNASVTYQDTLEIISKGKYLEMAKIFNTFTIIDLSHNQFGGNIPIAIGELKPLMGLNLSANNLTGKIPSSFAQLISLESLDLSKNSLSGEIPQQLGSLTFLSVLDLSQNHLSGMIPQGNQFGTFPAASYEGNVGLCGFPLTKRCGSVIERALPPASTLEKQKDSTSLFDWRFFIAGYCSGVIIGVVIGQTMFWRIIGWLKLTSKVERFKPEQRSKKYKSHGRAK